MPQNRPDLGKATRFKKGQTGNPGGRPKGLARSVREQMPAEDLVAGMVAIAMGEPFEGLKPRLADVLDARKWLAERGWGKPPAYAPVEEGDPLELDEVDRAIHGIVDELAAKRQTETARRPQNGTVAGNGKSGTASTGG